MAGEYVKNEYKRRTAIGPVIHDAQLWTMKKDESFLMFVTRCGLQASDDAETTQPTNCVTCLVKRGE